MVDKSCTYELRDGRMWVHALVSGREAWGIFDTGSDGTAIDADLANAIGLKARRVRDATTVSGKLEVMQVEPAKFDLGGAILTSSETNSLPLRAQLKGLEFILGFDALGSEPFEILPRDRTVGFGIMGQESWSQFALKGDVRPTVTMEVAGQSSHAFLDTGSGQGVSFPLRWVERNRQGLGIDMGDKDSRNIMGGGLTASKFELERIALGGAELHGVPAEAVESEEGSFAEQEALWGNVGNRALGMFDSIKIDGRLRRVSLLR